MKNTTALNERLVFRIPEEQLQRIDELVALRKAKGEKATRSRVARDLLLRGVAAS